MERRLDKRNQNFKDTDIKTFFFSRTTVLYWWVSKMQYTLLYINLIQLFPNMGKIFEHKKEKNNGF